MASKRNRQSSGQRRKFLASFITPSSQRLQDVARQGSHQRRAWADVPAGDADFSRAERRSRRRVVREQYLREVRQLKEARSRAERELDKHLSRREKVIAHQHGIFHYDPDNPRQVAAKPFVDKRFRQVERQQRELHKQQWDDTKRALERARDENYRQISRQMQQRNQQRYGLPSGMRGLPTALLPQLPWSDSAPTESSRLPSWRSPIASRRDWRVGDPHAGVGPREGLPGSVPDAGARET